MGFNSCRGRAVGPCGDIRIPAHRGGELLVRTSAALAQVVCEGTGQK